MNQRWMRAGLGAATLAAAGAIYCANRPVFLECANLAEANLERRQWAGADLSSADLQRANLQHANLPARTSAGLHVPVRPARRGPAGADLRCANVWGDLRGARLEGANVTLVMFTRQTQWPPEFHVERRKRYPVAGFPGCFNISYRDPEPHAPPVSASPAAPVATARLEN